MLQSRIRLQGQDQCILEDEPKLYRTISRTDEGWARQLSGSDGWGSELAGKSRANSKQSSASVSLRNRARADSKQTSDSATTRKRTVSSFSASLVPNPRAISCKRFLRLTQGQTAVALPDRAGWIDRIAYRVATSLPTPNAVHTTRFRWYSWLPKSLYWQMQRVANIYFVIIAVLSPTPLWRPRKWKPKVMVVTFVILLQALKELIEDLRRGRDDHQENTREVLRYESSVGGFVEVEWQCVQSGDLLLLNEGEEVPADILVLASNEKAGTCHVSTKSLDGETALKQRQALAQVHALLKHADPVEAAEEFYELGPLFVLDPPDADLQRLECSARVDNHRIGANLTNFVLRGSKLENTQWMLGVVCYVGNETKVLLNSAGAPTKISELERLLNLCVLAILGLVLLVSTICMVYSQIAMERGLPFYEVFVKYLIILYPIMPMTLYVTFEFMHLILGWKIEWDREMLDKASNLNAEARNTSLVEELGQIEYLFSDKTGTLTANDMCLAYCCAGNVELGPFVKDGRGNTGAGVALAKSALGQASVRDFFEFLAVCHTVTVNDYGEYNGESPDEVALVKCASSVGVAMVQRQTTPQGVFTLQVRAPWYEAAGVGLDGDRIHEVTHVLSFSSDRKRMSVVCRDACGGSVVLTKGADSVLRELLDTPLSSHAEEALSRFASQGLRTLVLGRKCMDASEFEAWRHALEKAQATMKNRAKLVEEVWRWAESGLNFVGITALEDRLQEGVTATISRLRTAAVRVWVLTGDKVETAVEIAKSCLLFDSDMTLGMCVDASSQQKARQALRNIEAIQSCRRVKVGSSVRGSFGIVLDGVTVACILEDKELKHDLCRIAEMADSCVCCRLSPLQKRLLVELVQEHNNEILTMSVGDGANDVPMIQGAHIGVGIRGKEGAAAVQASDFSISQFRFLSNLLLCHGRRAYRRIAVFLCFFLYKSVVVTWGYILYARDTDCQGQLNYPEWLDITYNPLTSCAVIVVLAFDFDVSDDEALAEPEWYRPGPQRVYLNKRAFLGWMGSACAHGLLCWSVPVYWLSTDEQRRSQAHEFWCASFVAFACVIIVVHLKLLIVARPSLTVPGLAAIVLEMAASIASIVVLGLPVGKGLAPELQGAPKFILSSWKHLFCIAVVPCACIASDAIFTAMLGPVNVTSKTEVASSTCQSHQHFHDGNVGSPLQDGFSSGREAEDIVDVSDNGAAAFIAPNNPASTVLHLTSPPPSPNSKTHQGDRGASFSVFCCRRPTRVVDPLKKPLVRE